MNLNWPKVKGWSTRAQQGKWPDDRQPRRRRRSRREEQKAKISTGSGSGFWGQTVRTFSQSIAWERKFWYPTNNYAAIQLKQRANWSERGGMAGQVVGPLCHYRFNYIINKGNQWRGADTSRAGARSLTIWHLANWSTDTHAQRPRPRQRPRPWLRPPVSCIKGSWTPVRESTEIASRRREKKKQTQQQQQQATLATKQQQEQRQNSTVSILRQKQRADL